MYSNRYEVTWVFRKRKDKKFSQSEKNMIQNTKDDFNDYYDNANKRTNRKYISNISFDDNQITICFETKEELSNVLRRGNALCKFSRLLAVNGFRCFVKNHRLMRTV